MGAVSVANGEPQAALPYFKRAQELGGSVASFACERGLAYDLLGQQAQAQADYRVALAGRDGDEARKRLALSLAIGGDRSTALQTLAPLSAKGDAGVVRVRAFVLALSGDPNSAMSAINAVMPGTAPSVAPFLHRLPSLSAGQKAAAVNLGIFPDSSAIAYSYAAPQRPQVTTGAGSNRLAGIDDLLNPRQAEGASVPAPKAMQVAYSPPPAPAVQRSVAGFQPKVWLQLASGQNVDDLAGRFGRIKDRNRELFDGIKPYVSRSADRARLLVGPFHGSSDAETFAEDLKSVGIDAFRFTNSQTDRIAPLATE